MDNTMACTAALIFVGLIVFGASAQWYGDNDEPEIFPLITNGSNATRKQFPYLARLLLHTKDGTILWCGGSIISNQWIVSAAHCIGFVSTGVDVIAGAWNRSDPTEKGRQSVFVQKSDIIMHEDWSTKTLKNDISLIKLPKLLEFNEYIKPIRLPKIDKPYPKFIGDYAIAAGWGRINDEPTPAVYPDILQWIKVPIIKNSICNETFPGWVHGTNICIDTTGAKSTCAGDSGGPLVLVSDEPELIGIDSFGNKTCETNDPIAFTRITSYLCWIKKHTGIERH